MHEEGWYVDPFGRHEARWISDGTLTALVRDSGTESHDPPPDAPYPGTLQPLADSSRPDGGDLRRADEAEAEMPTSAQQGRKVFDLFDQIGWPLSN